MKDRTHIRFALPKDIPQLIDLCEAHAIFEQSEYSKKHKAEKLAEGLFSKTPKVYCLVAEHKETLLGYASYTVQYSTWDADEYIYMDCLYLNASARGQNIGEQLIRRIQEEGKKLNFNLIQWQTPDFNTRAIKFYNRIGASSRSKERFYLKIN